MEARVDTDDLTAEQIESLLAKVTPALQYFYRLRRRIEQRGFPRDDKVRVLVERTHDALHDLRIALHYAACDRQRTRNNLAGYERRGSAPDLPP
jgi:hypothetical protein